MRGRAEATGSKPLRNIGSLYFLALTVWYWRAVSHYKATNDHTVLGKVAEELRRTYPSSVWASKAIPWLPKESKKEVA